MTHLHPDAARQHWLAILANSHVDALAPRLVPHLPDESRLHWLRQPHTGLVMVEGRIGGSGARFNLGEVTVSRASVTLDERTGHGHVKGCDIEHARLIAIADVLLQDPERYPTLQREVITPLEQAIQARREQQQRETAATKVEFFTMVRGED